MEPIGQLSNISCNIEEASYEEDQRIPDVQSSTSRSSRDKNRMEITVAEDVESRFESLESCDGNYTSTNGSRYRNFQTPPRPSSSKDLHRLVERCYREGSRSPQIMQLVFSTRTAIPLRVAITSAEYVHRIWEASKDDDQISSSQSQQQLTNYIANLLYQSSPSVTTLFVAIFYVGRLRRFYPKAAGEQGCGHRLFTISLLIAYRYLEYQSVSDERFYHQWSSFTNGIFQARDLLRMELEFVAFLKFNLYISLEDFEYFVDRVYNSDGGQIVPRSLDIPKLSKPFGVVPPEEEASVPSLQYYVL